MNYVPISYLPSRFVPYPTLKENQEKISIRKLTWGEVDFIYENKRHPRTVVDFYQDRKIVRGIDLYELTVDDWSFLELTSVSLTWVDSEFQVSGGTCPKCGEDAVQRIELGLGPLGETKYLEVKPNLRKVLVPADFSFSQLDEDVDLPITIKLENSTLEADFYRVKHYLDLYDDDLHRKKESIIEKMVGLSVLDIDFDAKPTLEYLYSKLRHGPAQSLDIKCPICSTVYRILTEWDVSRFIPFRSDDGLEGGRVTFGNISEPERTSPTKSRLSSRPELVQ